MLDIKNKSKLPLPDYIESNLRELCWKAHIAPARVTLIVKRRNRCVGDCWIKKGNRDIPSGQYKLDFRTIVVRIGKRTHRDDFRFILAHELGHLKQHVEQRRNLKTKLTEPYANQFAMQCNCYPHSKYRGIKLARKWGRGREKCYAKPAVKR